MPTESASTWETVKRKSAFAALMLAVVLSILLPVMWVHSYSHAAQFTLWSGSYVQTRYDYPDGHIALGGRQYEIISADGCVMLKMRRPYSWEFRGFSALSPAYSQQWEQRCLGFALATDRYRQVLRSWELSIPYWALATVLSALWAVWTRRRLRRWRWEQRFYGGCCVQCGYDLRASKEKCPECGTAIEERQRRWFPPIP